MVAQICMISLPQGCSKHLGSTRGLLKGHVPMRTSLHSCLWDVRGVYLHSGIALSHREEYSQFLREMIIQPGISKAKSGCSREDVTMEDHVSPTVPVLID